MARIRSIKPDFFTSDDICALSPLARLLYIALWCEADREGRLEWLPSTFKRRYLPEDACDIEIVSQELLNRDLVRLYGEGLAFIPTFAEHQRVNPRESRSTLPAPDLNASRQDLHASIPDVHAQVGREGKGREGKGKEGEGREGSTGREIDGGTARDAAHVAGGSAPRGSGFVSVKDHMARIAAAGKHRGNA